MHLVIDNREHKLIEIIQEQLSKFELNISFSIEPLDIGDFILYDSNDIHSRREVVIIERKSVSDLASSIKDGRYREQSLRLQNMTIHNHNIVYLIEGSIGNFCRFNKYNSMKEKTLYSTIWSLMYFKGFSVYHTESLQETAQFILRLVDKTIREHKKNKNGFYNNVFISETEDTTTNDLTQKQSNSNIKLKDTVYQQTISQSTQSKSTPYSHVVKKIKKENITPENIGHIILSQIPGISNTTSDAILQKYGSLYNLMKCLSNDPTCLNSMTYQTKKGQTRRISSKSIQSIRDYLLYMKDSTIEIDTSN